MINHKWLIIHSCVVDSFYRKNNSNWKKLPFLSSFFLEIWNKWVLRLIATTNSQTFPDKLSIQFVIAFISLFIIHPATSWTMNIFYTCHKSWRNWYMKNRNKSNSFHLVYLNLCRPVFWQYPKSANKNPLFCK